MKPLFIVALLALLAGCGGGGGGGGIVGGGLINLDFSRTVNSNQVVATQDGKPVSVPTGSVEGRVVDSSGQKVAGAKISIQVTAYDLEKFAVSNKEKANVAESDTENGYYSISQLPVEFTYQLTVEKEGYEKATRNVPPNTIPPHGSLRDFDLTLTPIVTQTGRVSGTIYDAATGLPLAGAAVTVGGRSGNSGSEGRFSLANVPAGANQTLQAQKSGYETGTRTVTVTANSETSNADLYLLPSTARPPAGPEL